MDYENLLMEACEENIVVCERAMPYTTKGLAGELEGSKLVWINKNMSEVEKFCTLAEEIGHIVTSSGNILDQNDVRNRKQERRARRWAIEKVITIDRLVDAFNSGCVGKYEVSRFLHVTEDFLNETIEHYRQKYGMRLRVDRYVIDFDNLRVEVLVEECF